MRQQFVVLFVHFGRGDGGRVIQCRVIVETNIFLHVLWNSPVIQTLTVSRKAMQITPCEFQKTVAYSFPGDRTVFACSGVNSTREVHCFEYFLIFGVFQWIRVSSMVPKRPCHSLSVKHRRKWVSRLLLLPAVSKHFIHRFQYSLKAQNFMQNMIHSVFWVAYCLSYRTHLRSLKHFSI